MATLYDINQNLLDLFAQIEEQDGEITEEQEHLLDINQAELKNKIEVYVNAISNFNSNIEQCKQESKRISDVKRKNENRIKWLKESIINAINIFGAQGKTNKFIELPTIRVSTKNTESVELNIERINILIKEFERYIRELVDNGVLYTGEDVDLKGILDAMNANCKAEYGEDFKPFTILDLTATDIKISTVMSIYDFFKENPYSLTAYGKFPIKSDIEFNTEKSVLKGAIKIAEKLETDNSTIASIKQNQSLIIK